MDAYLERVIGLQAEAANRMREILSRSDDLSAEDKEQLERFDADYDRLSEERKKLESYADKLAASDNLREAIDRAHAETREFGQKAPVSDAEKLISLLKGSGGAFDSTRTIPVGYQARALQSAGGSAIETSFADFVTVYERTLNPMLQISTVLSTRDGSPIVLPRLTADVATSGTVTAEAAGITEVDPTISSVTLNAYKRAVTTLWSAELGQDNIIGLDDLVARSIARHVGLAWGTAFTTGNDSSEANGFVTAAGGSATANGTTGNQATDTFFAASDLVDAYYALAAPYRQNATWVVANTALAKMRKFRDSTGQFLWSPALQAGQPESFLNRPVYENPAMAAVASASKSIAVGDFSRYIIRDVVPVRVDVSTEYKFNTDQIAIRYITRRDGDLPDTAAIRLVISANT